MKLKEKSADPIALRPQVSPNTYCTNDKFRLRFVYYKKSHSTSPMLVAKISNGRGIEFQVIIIEVIDRRLILTVLKNWRFQGTGISLRSITNISFKKAINPFRLIVACKDNGKKELCKLNILFI